MSEKEKRFPDDYEDDNPAVRAWQYLHEVPDPLPWMRETFRRLADRYEGVRTAEEVAP